MSVWFGLHLPSYTHPDTPPERLFDRVVEQAQAAEAAGFISSRSWTTSTRSTASAGPMSRCSRAGRCSPHSPARRRASGSARSSRASPTAIRRCSPSRSRRSTRSPAAARSSASAPPGTRWSTEGYGFPFPPIRERMDRLEEALAIIKAMFTEERPTFHGTYYRIERAFNVPRPVQPGGPKILVGGGGEQRTLRIAAKYADMTHWFALGLDALKHKTEVLERYCEEIGRDPSTIERTAGAPVIVTETEAEGTAILERLPDERRSSSRWGRRPGGRATVPTSKRALRASRSTTTCTRRPSRSHASARSSRWSRARRRSGHASARTADT